MPKTKEEVLAELKARYYDAGHRMQTGVAFMMEHGDAQDTTPKHLRVGVNYAMVDSAALAGLLIKKGLITDEEYLLALAEGMEREADAYQGRVDGVFGPGRVKLE